ncbi:hypothetical protein F5144DRAFT_179711 [Chaetomium tenue]|uniref:Uncharacterized protein n=1 Tax=Chaetomium tenue TaxID=1854479 RepID=A0ACB7PB75_9PEZI|nr:hypothetical protein F5144DRAFT_179711 [Chaetomium globosum]
MEALSLTARSTWTGTRRQVVAMGRMVKRMGALMKDVQELFVFLATCSKEMLAEIGRNTRLLLRIASQLKRVIQVIEAMPRDLGVDIIRLDDAWGETWGLPLQACGSWESFCDLLQRVVFAGKPGLDQVTDDQFAITLANAGRMNLNPFTWRLVLEKNIHIEQTMVVCRAYSKPSKACPFPGCSGMTILAVNGGKRCSTCGRQATIWRRAQSIINLEYAFPEFRRPPPIQLVDGEYQHFRRVQFQEPAEPIQSTGEVIRKMKENILDASTIAYNGGLVSQHVENDCLPSDETAAALKRVAIWLLAAVLLKCSVVDDRFLAEAYMRQGGGHEAGGAMNPAAHLALSVSICFNISGVTASRLGRDADALAAFSEALRLDPSQYLSWYNLAVLVDAYDETGLAIRCFEACLQRNPDLPQVEARLQVLRRHTAGTGPPPDDFKIHDLEDYELDILKGLDSELRDE